MIYNKVTPSSPEEIKGWENTDETGHCDITGPWRRLVLTPVD
jgi:hypothetical protein